MDEMNLARVEHYFSDFLSHMESGERLTLHSESFKVGGIELKDGQIPMPANLFVTGTVNVDETTHEISPKVLDRAHVVVLNSNWGQYCQKSPLRDDEELGDLFVKLLGENGLLCQLSGALAKVHMDYGYRTVEDIIRYVHRAVESGLGDAVALDTAVCNKVLPKIRGTQSKALESVLDELAKIAGEFGLESCNRHLKRMRDDLNQSGFVAFKPI